MTVRIEPEDAREALALEAAALRDAVSDSDARSLYDELARALAGGEVDERLAGALERLLELTLRSGRSRRLHGPGVEAAAIRLYHETGAGRAAGAGLREVNSALAALGGQRLEGISFAGRGPGAYSLTIDTATAALTLEIDGAGVAVRSVSVEA